MNKQTLGQIVRGVLKGVLHDHGPIENNDHVNSATKWVVAQVMAHAEKNFMKQGVIDELLSTDREE